MSLTNQENSNVPVSGNGQPLPQEQNLKDELGLSLHPSAEHFKKHFYRSLEMANMEDSDVQKKIGITLSAFPIVHSEDKMEAFTALISSPAIQREAQENPKFILDGMLGAIKSCEPKKRACLLKRAVDALPLEKAILEDPENFARKVVSLGYSFPTTKADRLSEVFERAHKITDKLEASAEQKAGIEESLAIALAERLIKKAKQYKLDDNAAVERYNVLGKPHGASLTRNFAENSPLPQLGVEGVVHMAGKNHLICRPLRSDEYKPVISVPAQG